MALGKLFVGLIECLYLKYLLQSSDLVNAKGSEMDKIQEMIKQSTRDFDPSK